MAQPDELLELKTREQVIEHYRQLCPLLAAYDDVIAEHAGPRQSINVPWTGGIEQRAAARLALARIGRPARDDEDIRHAVAFIEQMERERASLYIPVVMEIRDYVIRDEFSIGGRVQTAEEWLEGDQADQACFLDSLVRSIPTDDLRRLLRDTMEYAMPGILRHITGEDDDRRRRATLRPA